MLRNSAMPHGLSARDRPAKVRKRERAGVKGAGVAVSDAESPADKLLEAAMRLFCREGIHATGVDRILAEAGTAKATLYKQFGSKDSLVHEALRRHGDEWRAWFNASLDAYPGGPGERLIAIFDVLQQWFDRDDYFGCAFINAVAEHDKADEAIRSLALDHKRQLLGRVRALAEATGAEAPEALAQQIGLLMDGAIIAALVTGSSAPAKTARAAAEALVKCATASPHKTAAAQTRRAPSTAVKRRAERPGS